jgi:hypothetical protein
VIASDPTRNLFNQSFSPDQRWISFLAHDLSHESTSTIYGTPSGGGPWRPMTEGVWFDDKPHWGRMGRVLYFVSNRTGVANVWGRRFDGASGAPVGEPFSVTSCVSAQFQLTPRTAQMDIVITATRLLLPITESRSDIWMLDGPRRSLTPLRANDRSFRKTKKPRSGWSSRITPLSAFRESANPGAFLHHETIEAQEISGSNRHIL